MTSDRPYRKAMSDEDACRELERCKGTQFDPEITDAFLKCKDEWKAEVKQLRNSNNGDRE
jgi:HD-GYP domain-containing protein (c-di-GMP phosphodiesterase class II)